MVWAGARAGSRVGARAWALARAGLALGEAPAGVLPTELVDEIGERFVGVPQGGLCRP